MSRALPGRRCRTDLLWWHSQRYPLPPSFLGLDETVLEFSTTPAPARVLEPHGRHGLGILHPWCAGADCSSLALVPGQAHRPFPKLEALLHQVCGLGRGGGAGHKGLICVFWRAAGAGSAAPLSSACWRNEVRCPFRACLPLKNQAQKKTLLSRTCLRVSHLPWRRTCCPLCASLQAHWRSNAYLCSSCCSRGCGGTFESI